MRKNVSKALAASIVTCLFSVSVARGQYRVTSSTVNIGPATWQFTYQVTNIDQGMSGHPYGLDGFAIQIPDSATVTGWTVPDPYVSGSIGSWVVTEREGGADWFGAAADPGYHWMSWWGIETLSVYPPGSTATLSVTLSDVSVGSNDGVLVTYWGLDVPPVEYVSLPPWGNYTPYVRGLVSPMAAIPERMIRPVEGYLFRGFTGSHPGIDIVALQPGDIAGRPIVAAAGGTVVGVNNSNPNEDGGYWIQIDHGDIERADGRIVGGVHTVYCHLQSPPSLTAGASVTQGQVVGNVGMTGGPEVTGFHLHFEVRESGARVDPLGYVSYSYRPGSPLEIEAHCPVDITVIDPEGYHINKSSIEIEGVVYWEEDSDEDGDLEDWICVPNRKVGVYTITVVTQSGALPTDTYTLAVTADGTTITLAEDVPVADIPAGPYLVRVSQDGPPVDVTPPVGVPVFIDVYPGRTANQIYLAKNYTIYVGVLGSSIFDVADLDSATVRFGHSGTEAKPVRAPTIRDLNGDGRNDALYGFMTFDCQFKMGDTKGVLTGQMTDGTNVTGDDSVVVFLF